MPAGAERPSRPSTRVERWGLLALLLRPVYIVVELAVAAGTTGDYSLVGDSVSRLAESGCSPAFCAPRHDVMNGAFIVVGTLLAVGAAFSTRVLGRVAAGLLVLSGVSSIATGLLPLDSHGTAHAVAATPLFVAQPLALGVLARRCHPARPLTAVVLGATGVVATLSAAAFVAAGEGGGSGVFERLALWSVLLALAAFAWPRRHGA